MRLMTPFRKNFSRACCPRILGTKKTALAGRPSDLLLEGFFSGLGLLDFH